MRRSWLSHRVSVTNKGAEARRAGLPRQAPYGGRNNLNKERIRDWLEGWDCADREIREADEKARSSDARPA